MAPEMVTRADTARLFFRCNDPGDPVFLPADDRAVRRLPAVNKDLWNAHMHGNMDIGPDSDAEGSVKAPPPRTRTPTSRSDRIAVS